MKKLAIGLVVILALAAGAYYALIWSLTKPAPPLEPGPVISLPQGDILSGIDRDNPNIVQVNGIPFAAPPIGDLRWRPPQPAAGWEGVRDGTAFGAQCLQYRGGTADFIQDIADGLGLSWVKKHLLGEVIRRLPDPVESEDCLFLNVRTGNPGAANLKPVMVWIHGGSHQTGSGSLGLYQADGLVDKGVVLVTINYRVGAFGYLAHPALSADDPRGVSGNYGLLDQIAALQWVRDNIHAFGGDPGNVTIFGESAGAQSVSEILASRLGDGLYHKAILQSGSSSYNALGLERAIDGRLTMHEAGLRFMEGLTDADASASTLRAIPAEALIARAGEDQSLAAYLLPNVDGVVIEQLIGEAIGDGSINNVPILAGYNADEGTLFYDWIDAPTVLASPFPDRHAERMAKMDEIYGDEDAAILNQAYGLSDPDTYTKGATDMLGDDLFGIHMRYLAKSNVEQGEPAWLYHFRRVPPSPRQTLGAFHSLEIYFVFGSGNALIERTDKDDALDHAMSTYWTNFARTGDPNDEGVLDWPTYSAETDRWMTFNPETRVETGVRKAKLDIMERVLRERIALAAPKINPVDESDAEVSGGEQDLTNSFEP